MTAAQPSWLWRLVADAHGEGAAMALALAFGGQVVSLPAKPNPLSPIARACGEAVMATLCKAMGGEKVYIPLGPTSQRRQQQAAVEAAIRGGVPIREIIRRFGVSRAGVYRARARLLRSADEDLKPISAPR
ncbi:MAG: Mor transcription activator family protein [Rhodospirillales bacterium]